MIKEIAIRLFVYPFCIFLFALGYKMTFEPLHYENSIYESRAYFYGPMSMIFSFIYPITDILIFLKKQFKKKNDNLK